MTLRLFSAIVIVAAVAAVATQSASAAAKTRICGQVKHGPYAAYTQPVNGKKLKGTTWTVFSTGVPCSVAMKAAPKILKWWAKAKVGASNYNAGGFGCNKESDGHGSAGTAGCSYAKGSLANIELMMTGSYTIGQLKQLFFIS